MSKIYNIYNKLMFEDEGLSLKELVEKNKKNLKFANLKFANLEDADLTNADLTGARLTGADLRFTDLTGARLTGANLTNADLTEANLDFALYSSETVSNCGKTVGELIKKQRE